MSSIVRALYQIGRQGEAGDVPVRIAGVRRFHCLPIDPSAVERHAQLESGRRAGQLHVQIRFAELSEKITRMNDPEIAAERCPNQRSIHQDRWRCLGDPSEVKH